jgi:hypothetical protein
MLVALAALAYVQLAGKGWFQQAATAPTIPVETDDAKTSITNLLLTRLAEIIPPLSLDERERSVRDYVQSNKHKAQAVSLQPPATWRASDRTSAFFAEEGALENCQVSFGQPCLLVAVNDDVLPNPPNGSWPRHDMPRVRYSGNFDPNQIPGGVDLRQRSDIISYAVATSPKALAYHPTSRMYVVIGAETQRAAEEKVLNLCNSDPTRPPFGFCFLYAIGNQVVLPQRLRKPTS